MRKKPASRFRATYSPPAEATVSPIAQTPAAAEGVEDAAALERLRELGCQEVQGYYLARPMPATALEALLVSGQTLPVVIRSASSGLPPCDGMGRVSGFTPPPVGVHSF